MVELDKDPFKQPDMLKYKPPAPADKKPEMPGQVEVPELQLNATLISVTEPMVLVNNTFLHIGEKIEGMKLIIIDEGRAIFRYKGRNYEYFIDNADTGNKRR